MSLGLKTTLLNRSKVKQFALEVAKTRAHKFTRVGSEFYWQCETNLKEFIRGQIHRHPSKGKTLR